MNRNRQSERGVALVITLVMLSVVTLMAVFFLGISRREKASVTVASDLVGAKLMADAALARAQSEVVTRLLSATNRFAYDLLVSTNMINPEGYTPSRGNSPTNVAYYDTSKGQMAPSQLLGMLANLQYDPRPPVYIPRPTSANAPQVRDFRFYLDLNRNGIFEPSGWVQVRDGNGLELRVNGQNIYDYVMGDPQWIGMLERPDLPHSGSNRFVGRYAYLVMPAGKSLDINYIHNYTRPNSRQDMPSDRFYRNQGVGSWEINLAAFLRELNTNIWSLQNPNNSYFYDPVPNNPNAGAAFSDALAILRHRYSDNNQVTLANLFSAERIYSPAKAVVLRNDGIDSYSDGPLMDLTLSDPDLLLKDPTELPWAGSENPSRISHIFELFELGNIYKGNPPALVMDLQNRLNRAFSDPVRHPDSTYDKYTFYRMLAQMGTESHEDDTTWVFGPDFRRYPTNKININFRDDEVFPLRELTTWTNNLSDNRLSTNAVAFFTQTADRLLRVGIATNIFTNTFGRLDTNFWMGMTPSKGATLVSSNFALTNIQIYHNAERYPGASSEYNATVHRLLQLAANIYDAAHPRYYPLGTSSTNSFPTVFRPYFAKTDTNVIIAGYEELVSARALTNNAFRKYSDVREFYTNAPGGLNRDAIIKGVPFIVATKKGYPAFNEFNFDTSIHLTRKLELRKQVPNGPVLSTNQIHILSVSNLFGMEAWNSYASDFQRSFEIIAENRYSFHLYAVSSDDAEFDRSSPAIPPIVNLMTKRFSSTNWPGNGNSLPAQLSFVVPLETNIAFLSQSAYRTSDRTITPTTNPSYTNNYETSFGTPRLLVAVTNQVDYTLIDSGTGRVIDYVSLEPFGTEIDVQGRLVAYMSAGANRLFSDERLLGKLSPGDFWDMRRVTDGVQNSPTWGVRNQLAVSEANPDVTAAIWKSALTDEFAGQDKVRAVEGFKDFIYNRNRESTKTRMQAPFSPSVLIFERRAFQANDPLVHYTLEDLYDRVYSSTNNPDSSVFLTGPGVAPPNKSNLGQLNKRYRPWGGNPSGGSGDATSFSWAFKDPGIRRSDDWSFPTNLFPSIGWLGKVHRGTPWQTIYLKSEVASPTNWIDWNWSAGTHPTNDWRLLDIFTTAISPTASRGLLSVNQTNIAAWSAVLSGVNVVSNSPYNAAFATHYVQPASSQVMKIVEGINKARQNVPGGRFQRLGDILAAPELSVASPFVFQQNTTRSSSAAEGEMNLYLNRSASEEAVERLPRQILGLLKNDEPRVVIYSFGQALKPAERSIVTMGQFYNMCTNYQVTAEVVTKTVVRFDGPEDNPKAVVESFSIVPNQ